MNAETPHPDPFPAACRPFRETVQAVIDGVLPPDALEGSHPAGCPDCRSHAAAARRLLTGLGELNREPRAIPTDGFAERVVRAALRQRRVRAFRHVGAGLAVAAGLLAAVVLTRPGAPPTEPPVAPRVQEFARQTEPIRVGDEFEKAGSALAALTRRTADETFGPTQTLISAVQPPAFSTAVVAVPPESEPAVESLAGMPQAIGDGFEPVTNSARRAVSLFLRDTGLSAVAATY